MTKKRSKDTPGRKALREAFNRAALVYDPDFGEIHNQLGIIEYACRIIRKELNRLARERKTKRQGA
jgi:hypothetical protein